MSAVKMITKTEALKIVGVSRNSKVRKDVYSKLNHYANPHNPRAIFREDEVVELVKSFKISKEKEVEENVND